MSRRAAAAGAADAADDDDCLRSVLSYWWLENPLACQCRDFYFHQWESNCWHDVAETVAAAVVAVADRVAAAVVVDIIVGACCCYLSLSSY